MFVLNNYKDLTLESSGLEIGWMVDFQRLCQIIIQNDNTIM